MVQIGNPWQLLRMSVFVLCVGFYGCKPEAQGKKAPASNSPQNPNGGYPSTPQVPIGTTAPVSSTPSWTQTSTFSPLSGCLKNQPLQQVEIAINGAIEAPRIIDKGAKRPRSNDGVPGQMTFEFNSGLAYSATDAINQLKANQGKIIIRDLASYTVDQIAYIKVSLDGHSFQSTQYSERDFWSGEVTKYQIVETNRFLINTLTIIINGREFYRTGALGVTLNAGQEFWQEPNLAQNLVTKKILLEDCSAMPTVAPVAPGTPAPAPTGTTPTQ